MAPPQPISLPSSYSDLNGTEFTQIRVSHYPPSSPTPTPIIVLTLYRPGRHNAFTNTMMQDLERAFGMFDVDNRVKCIVVTGDGRIFCAGADLETGFGDRKNERAVDHRDGGGRAAIAIHHCRKPVIGALQGSAVGVGITMTLPMSIRIALRSAKIGFVFARRGIIMEACSSYFLPRLIGHSKAMHLITTGATYRADDKLLDGLFSEVCDTPEQVMQRALEIAEEVVANTSVVSYTLCKELMWRNPGTAEGTHLLDSRVIYDLFDGKDNNEGVKSFLEKRAPKFTGTMESDAPTSYPWWEQVHITGRSKAEEQKEKAKL